MADFRRCILALALLALVFGLGSVAPASAQTNPVFSCTASAAVPPTMRHEGYTELIGDIVLQCTGGTPTPSDTVINTANVTVFLTNSLTSRITGSPDVTDALLLIDEPNASQQIVCPFPTNPEPIGFPPGDGTCAEFGDNGGSFATNGYYNVFQGILTGSNAVTFLGVPIDPPTTSGSPARVLRITNIRTNAAAYATGPGGVTPVQAFISISSSSSVPIDNAEPIVGFIAQGLLTSASLNGSNAFLQCQSQSEVDIASLTFTENFATAFKIQDGSCPNGINSDGGSNCLTGAAFDGQQNIPGQIYNTESGLIVPLPSDSNSFEYAGLADYGTRLKATFSNLPHGVTLEVDTSGSSALSGGSAILVASTFGGGSDAVANSGFGGPVGVGSTVLEISYPDSTTPNAGSAEAVWEVTGANTSAIDSFTFNVYLSFTGAPGNPGSPDITGTSPQSMVNLTFAPTPNGGAFTADDGGLASSFLTIPRFADSTSPTALFTVSLCQTILLFPYVSDLPGFDTGIAISNTSQDPLPAAYTAAPQQGACTVTFYGTPPLGTTAAVSSAPPPYSSVTANLNGTGLIGPGQTWAFDVANSIVDPAFPGTLPPGCTPGDAGCFTGFTGYAIAICDFQYAHGYSFVSDLGLRNFAAAYLALVIPDTVRTATPNICSAAEIACQPYGEQLVH